MNPSDWSSDVCSSDLIAIDVADVVVMKNDLSKLGYAHRVSKRLNKIVQQNIIFSDRKSVV